MSYGSLRASLPTFDTTESQSFPVEPLFIGNPVNIDGILVTDYLASQDLNECVAALVSNCDEIDARNTSYHYLGTKVNNKKAKPAPKTEPKEKRSRMTKE
jgi:hypothetical protein